MQRSYYARATLTSGEERLVAVTWEGESFFRVINVSPQGQPVSDPYPITRSDLISLKELELRKVGEAPAQEVSVGIDLAGQGTAVVIGHDADGNPIHFNPMPRAGE